jgi:hypothetical protein
MSDLASPAVSLSDFYYQVAGFECSSLHLFGEHLDAPAMQVDLPALGLDFAVPIFFFEGTADQQTPIEIAEQYYEQIRTPHKEFVRFAGGHHFIALNMADEFLKELLGQFQSSREPRWGRRPRLRPDLQVRPRRDLEVARRSGDLPHQKRRSTLALKLV